MNWVLMGKFGTEVAFITQDAREEAPACGGYSDHFGNAIFFDTEKQARDFLEAHILNRAYQPTPVHLALADYMMGV